MWPRPRPSPFPAVHRLRPAAGTSANIDDYLQHRRGGGGATAPTCSGANIAAVGSTLTFSASCTQGTNPITSVTLNGVSLCSGAALYEPLSGKHTRPRGSGEHDQLHRHGFGWHASRFLHGDVRCRRRRRRRRRLDLSGCTAAGYTGRGSRRRRTRSTANTSIPNGASSGVARAARFGNNDALVVRFTTPAAGVNNQTVFQPAGNPPSQNTDRVYTLSTLPCQFATSSEPTGSIRPCDKFAVAAVHRQVVAEACPYTGA